MSRKYDDITAYILAGGKSSRMGRDKGLMLLGNKPMVEHVAFQLQQVTNKVVIISNNIAFEKPGLEVIPDLIKDIGPAGGIYTALSHSSTALNFIISCDMPLMTASVIDFIISQSSEFEITIPVLNGRLEPLCSVYSKKCLYRWQSLIQSGAFKLHDIVSHFYCLPVDMNGMNGFDEALFLNINTPEDVNKLYEQQLLS